MEKPRNKFKKWPIIAVVGLILLFLSFVVTLPYYIEVPGGAADVRQVLRVDNEEGKKKYLCPADSAYILITMLVKLLLKGIQ